jgi:PPOX class probable F420-dependent enzyme
VASIDDALRLIQLDVGLATLATVRPDGSAQLTVVNAGIVEHPTTHDRVAAFVARGGTHKVDYLRANPRAALQWRAGWAWVTVEGTVELCGPDDPLKGVDDEGMRRLMQDIARASGMGHDDWTEFDRVVAAERRTAVLINPARIYRNP